MMTTQQKLCLALLSFHWKRIKTTLATDKDIRTIKYLREKVYGEDKKINDPIEY